MDDSSELNDLEDSYSQVDTTHPSKRRMKDSSSRNRSPGRSRSPGRGRGKSPSGTSTRNGKRPNFNRPASERFKRSSSNKSPIRGRLDRGVSNGGLARENSTAGGGAASKHWQVRESHNTDQSNNIMEMMNTSYHVDLKESNSKRSERSVRTVNESVWESQSLRTASDHADYNHRMENFGQRKKERGSSRRWRVLLGLLGTFMVVAILMLTVPKSGLVLKSDEQDDASTETPKAEETTPPEADTKPPTSDNPPETDNADEESPAEDVEEQEEETPLQEGALTEEEEQAMDLEYVPQDTRVDALRFYVVDQDVSEQAQLDIMGSPAKKALHWITQRDHALLEIPGVDADAPDEVKVEHALLQRYALAVFYYSQEAPKSTAVTSRSPAGATRRHLRVANMKNITQEELDNRKAFDESWLSVKPVCEWHGVVCADDAESVVEVNLPKHLLQGTIPRELLVGAAMPHLKKVDLTQNKLHGDLPVVTRERDNAGEQLGLAPHESTLQVLHLGGNRLTGKIDMISGFSQLKTLTLEDNLLAGAVSDETLGQLTQLEKLQLSNNFLTGELPSLSAQTSLQKLVLSGNDFTGTIPSSFGELRGLQDLHLDGNGLQGTVPTQLGQLTKLGQLYLEATNLTGDMPSEVCSLRRSAPPLRSLVAQCEAITCSCCTQCF